MVRPTPSVPKPPKAGTPTGDVDRALELKVEKMARAQARVGQTVRGGKA